MNVSNIISAEHENIINKKGIEIILPPRKEEFFSEPEIEPDSPIQKIEQEIEPEKESPLIPRALGIRFQEIEQSECSDDCICEDCICEDCREIIEYSSKPKNVMGLEFLDLLKQGKTRIKVKNLIVNF
jgi:hypothetical protein